MRIVFMGTPEFALPTLERLMAGGHEVAGVYTQPDRPAGRGRAPRPSPVKRAALAHGLPLYQPERLRSGEATEQLTLLGPEAIVVCAYGLLLPPHVLAIPPLGCLNLHPSLLPRHRGPSPIPAAILSRDHETGVTIMLMDRGMDTGPILAQVRLAIEEQDTTATLTQRLAETAADLLMETLPRWAAGALTPQPQDESQATVTRLAQKEDGELDWQLPAEELWRRVRAFQPWPGCFTLWEGRLLKVLETTPLDQESGLPPGTVLSLPKGAVLTVRGAGRDAEAPEPAVGVQTGRGVLALLRVQPEGRRPMTGPEFVRGQRGFSGSRLPSPPLLPERGPESVV